MGGHLIERGVYRIFLRLYWAFIGEGHLKERGHLLEKIRYLGYKILIIMGNKLVNELFKYKNYKYRLIVKNLFI